jgi:hypothetical protein
LPKNGGFFGGAQHATNEDVTFGRRRLCALLAVGAVTTSLACAAPTLPLPPPAAPQVTSLGQNQYLLRAERGAEPHAIVLIYNKDPEVPLSERVYASEANAEGTWEKTITAKPGSFVDIWQDTGNASSPQISIQLPR